MTTISHSTFLCFACGQEKQDIERYVSRSKFILCQSCASKGKVCPTCEKYKSFAEFAKEGREYHQGGVTGYCKLCKRKRNKKEHNPAKQRAHNLKVHFNLTPLECDEMIAQQNGLCAICGKPERAMDPRTGKVRRLAIDHDHETGKIRQPLCSSCNYWLGVIEKDYDRIERMVSYLKKHNFKHKSPMP